MNSILLAQKMTDAFTIKNYSILTSLNKTQIYIKMVDTVTHMVYETNVDNGELRLSITLEDVYKIITACFGEDDGYKVAITVRSGLMKMKFHAVIGGFLKIDFDILIKEKLMTNDTQLSLFMHQLEQKQESAFEALVIRCDQLGRTIERLENTLNLVSCAEIEMRMNTFVPLNSQSLTIQGDAHMKADKIHCLYKLQKLNLTQFSLVDLTSFTSYSLRELCIDSTGNNKFISLRGIDSGFPNLESLVIANAASLRDVSSLYKSKIKTVKIIGQSAFNIVELKTYCIEHKISLSAERQ